MLRIVIPQIFENMEEATIGAWLVAEGEMVRAGQALCELITEKTTFELQAEGDGILRRIVAPEKSIVPTGFIVALIGEGSEALPDIEAENALLRERETGLAETSNAAPDVPTLRVPVLNKANVEPDAGAAQTSGTRLRATPAARRAARERGVTLEEVAAAFPGKVLSEDDVAQFASSCTASS